MADRQSEVENMLMTPVYTNIKALTARLGYEPIIYPPGRSGNQAEDKREVTVVCDFEVSDREAATIGGSMYVANADFVVSFAVPEKTPTVNAHGIIRQAISTLQGYYSVEFCNDAEQVYLDDISWTTSVDSTSRTEYILTLAVRFHDYPNREAS